MGLQGGRLSRFLSKPIRIESIRVSRPPEATADELEKALRRAIVERSATAVEELRAQLDDLDSDAAALSPWLESWRAPEVMVVEDAFPFSREALGKASGERAGASASDAPTPKKRKVEKRSARLKPDSLCSNWYLHETEEHGDENGGTVEITSGSTGRKQGASKASTSPATESRLCTRQLEKQIRDAGLSGKKAEDQDPDEAPGVEVSKDPSYRALHDRLIATSPFVGWSDRGEVCNAPKTSSAGS